MAPIISTLYASVKMMNTLLDLIRQLYQARSCSLTWEAPHTGGQIQGMPRISHQQLPGPCEGLQTEEDYQQSLTEIRNILRGNISSARQHLAGMMRTYAETYQFEKAQVVKEKLSCSTVTRANLQS